MNRFVSSDDVERLIETVRNQPALWHKTSLEYRIKKSEKDLVWTSVATKCKSDVESCKLTWYYLKKHYNTCRSKSMRNRNDTERNTISWRWSPLLRFLESNYLPQSFNLTSSTDNVQLAPTMSNRVTDNRQSLTSNTNSPQLARTNSDQFQQLSPHFVNQNLIIDEYVNDNEADSIVNDVPTSTALVSHQSSFEHKLDTVIDKTATYLRETKPKKSMDERDDSDDYGTSLIRMLRKMHSDIRDQAFVELTKIALDYIEISKKISIDERVIVADEHRRDQIE